jgi:hypothetical protein
MAVFRSSQKSDRNSCWSVYRAVQAGNRLDMLLGSLWSLVTPDGQECEMLMLASAEEQAFEDDMGC